MRVHSLPLIFILMFGVLFTSACSTMPKEAKVVLTPVTVVRDVVDLPFMGLTNFFAWSAGQSGDPVPRASAGWSLLGGPNAGVGIDIGAILFGSLSVVFGVVDYVICRSLFPNSPWGVSPWKSKDNTWKEMVFPNTQALWAIPEPGEEPGLDGETPTRNRTRSQNVEPLSSQDNPFAAEPVVAR